MTRKDPLDAKDPVAAYRVAQRYIAIFGDSMGVC